MPKKPDPGKVEEAINQLAAKYLPKRRRAPKPSRFGPIVRATVTYCDSPRMFRKYVELVIRELEPMGELETKAAEGFASSDWSLHRAWAIKAAMLDRFFKTADKEPGCELLTDGFSAFVKSGPDARMILRCEDHFQRQSLRSLKTFKEIRAIKKSSFDATRITEKE